MQCDDRGVVAPLLRVEFRALESIPVTGIGKQSLHCRRCQAWKLRQGRGPPFGDALGDVGFMTGEIEERR